MDENISNISNFLINLETILKAFGNIQHSIFVGDINNNLNEHSDISNNYLYITDIEGYLKVITKPTKIQHNTYNSSCIDHVSIKTAINPLPATEKPTKNFMHT